MAIQAALRGFNHTQALSHDEFEAYFDYFRTLKNPIAQLHSLRWVILPNASTTDEIAKRFIKALPAKLQQGLGFSDRASLLGSPAITDCEYFIVMLEQAKTMGVFEETLPYLRKIAEFTILITASDEVSIREAISRFDEVESPIVKLEMFESVVHRTDLSHDVVRQFYDRLPVSFQNGFKRHIWIAHGRDDKGMGIARFADHVINTNTHRWIARQAIHDYIAALLNARNGIETHSDLSNDEKRVQRILSHLPLVSIDVIRDCLSTFAQIESPIRKMTVFQALLNAKENSYAITQFYHALPTYLQEKFKEQIKVAMGGEGACEGYEELFVFAENPYGPFSLKATERVIAHLRTLPKSE